MNLDVNTFEKTLQDSVQDLLNTLKDIPNISSQGDIETIISFLDGLLNCLPGPLTVQKALNFDYSEFNWEIFAENTYFNIINQITNLFDDHFPYCNGKIYENILKLFSIENQYFFTISFNVLLKYLDKKKNVVVLMILIENLIKSEGLFDFICEYIINRKNLTDIEKTDKIVKWEEIVQLLISLPTRIANYTKGKINDLFKCENFSKFLVGIVIKTIEFLAKITERGFVRETLINYTVLGLLLNKILINYNERLKSQAIKNFVNIILIWHQQPNNIIYRTIISNLFKNLPRNSVEIMAVFLLQNTPTHINIHDLIENVLEYNCWKFVFSTKIPMLSYYNHEHTNLIINLVNYVNKVSSEELLDLLRNLLITWSNKSAINHTTIEQHIYISKFIVVAASQLEVSLIDKSKLLEILHSGITHHLSSPNETIRITGMITSEIVFHLLNRGVEESNIKLTFDYENISPQNRKLVDDMRELSTYRDNNQESEINVQKIIEEIFAISNTNSVAYKPPERQFKKKPTNTPKNDVISGSIVSKNNLITIIDGTNLDLDSDDDLEPYDLSNDVAVPKKPPPAYLRDIRDGLLENQDIDLFTQSVQNCANIVRNQLPNDDSSIGREILDILLTLTPTFHVENFESLVFESCVAIVCVYPAQYAEYLAEQFHTDTGTYSISHRVLILHILSAASMQLSSLKPKEKTQKTQKPKTNLETAEEIIKSRLEAKTRRFPRYKRTVNETVNTFSNVAGSFFYPLLHGFGRNYVAFNPTIKNDNDYILLVNFLQTISTIMCAAQNCPIASRMAKEILMFGWFIRFHKEAKVRLGVITLFAAVILNLPKSIIIDEFVDKFLEIHFWLSDLLSSNVQRGDPCSECRSFAAHLKCLIENVLKDNEQ